MSSRSSDLKGVDQMGKLVIHIAENGHSYELDSDECTLVETVQKSLERVCGIPFNDQLLLCLDMKLEPQRPLSAYKLPSGEREVFLFNKARMRSNSPCPAPEQVEITNMPDPPSPSSSQNPHPLDDAPDPALKALPSYERQFRYHFQFGHAIYTQTLAKYEACERLLQEQMVQERALEIARGNLDYFYRIVLQNYTDFVKCYLQQHRTHTSLLVNFGRDMEKLKSVRLHPSLQTPNRKCLLDFMKEENLPKTVEDCSSSHRQFDNKVSDFKKEFSDLKRNAEDLFSSKASFLVKDLEFAIKDRQRFINEQKSIMQALSKDVNIVKRLVDDCVSSELSSSIRPHDAVSALGPMYDSHDKSYLPKMQECDNGISDLLNFCRDKKNEMNIFVHNYMQKIAYLQYSIKDVRCKFSVFQDALNRQIDQFEQLKVVRGIGPAYRACLAEVVRRKEMKKIYLGKAGQLAEKLAAERNIEVRRREDFLKVNSAYIPQDVLASMGLYDTPTPCNVNVNPFDTNLLDLDISDVDRYAPDSLTGISSRNTRTSLSISNDGSQSSVVDEKYDFQESIEESELVEVAGTSKMEVENAKLKAELASKIALLCSMSTELNYESLDQSEIENMLRNATEKTSEALYLKDEYKKHLQSMLKAKQMQCDSYEKRIQELEQRLSDQYLRGESISEVSNAKNFDQDKPEVLGVGEMEDVSSSLKFGLVVDHDKAQEELGDNMTDSSIVLNPLLDSSMVDIRDKKEKKDAQLPDISMTELQNVLLEKSSELENAETKIQCLMDEVSKLEREMENRRELLTESQLNCAHLENCLHEAREEAQTHLCAADRRASEYSALRISAVKTRGLLERLKSCVMSAGVATFADSLLGLAQSLSNVANENDDDELRECIRVLADKVGLLSRQRAELLDRHTRAETSNEILKKELEEKKEMINTLYVKHQLEKQANKEKISFGRLDVHEIAAFILNSSGYYEAINRNSLKYFVSAECVSLFTEHVPSRPRYIVGQVVHIERQVAVGSNPYGVGVGCEYFVVTIAMLPDTTIS